MNTRARVAAWLAEFELEGLRHDNYEDLADELIKVVFADGGE